MIIRVDTKENLLIDLCYFLNIDIADLYFAISDLYEKSMCDLYFDENRFFELSSQFISERNNDILEEVYLCHLTRSIDCPTVLMPLPQLLTTDNSFTSFLNRNKLEFSYEYSKIFVRYKGVQIDEDKLSAIDRAKRYYGRLGNRFGYNILKDYCVNGFMFAINPETSTDNYYAYLKQGPELLQDLDAFLQTDLCSEFCKLSNMYFALSKVSINDVIYDENEQISDLNEKTKTYLSICFKAVYDLFVKSSDTILDNAKLRIADDKEIGVDAYIEV